MKNYPATASLKNKLRRLRHQAVRDLAWCCFSPPLMSRLPGTDVAMFPQITSDTWQWLLQLDKNPEALLLALSQSKSSRLGIYYENLWHFYFVQQSQWELLAHNQQIHQDGITLGAFDFLCRRGKEFWHFETAVKFYLCTAKTQRDAGSWQYWIGPTQEDRLDIKLTRLLEHQLPLSRHAEGAAWLQRTFPQAQHWRSGLFLQGYFFKRFAQQHPDMANPHHHYGYWLPLRDFMAMAIANNNRQWYWLARHEWLSPAQVIDSQAVLTGTALCDRLADWVGDQQHPVLVAQLDQFENQSVDFLWQETTRYFVMPDHWPATN